MKQLNADRIERWLGKDRMEALQLSMKGWYGAPINLADVPGSVWVDKDGDFVGNFDRGFFYSAADSFYDHLKHIVKRINGNPDLMGAGFASIGDALSRASQGYSQLLNGGVSKTGATGVLAVTNTLWDVGTAPAAGAAGSALPGGRAPTKATTGAMGFNNPASGTLHLTGADFSCSVINNSLMLYDRIFDVAVATNSTGTQACTGVPTRYQSSTVTNPDYIGGNFLFIEIVTALNATAHNWTVCQYTDQDNNATQTLPTVTGNASGIARRLDQPANTWFCPLASGDVGIKALSQAQISAITTGAVNFVIGHPIGIMSFPVINSLLPFDWLTNRQQAPRIFDDACLALLELCKPATTATSYVGQIYVTNAAA